MTRSKGFKHSKETVDKITATLNSPEHKLKRRLGHLGNNNSMWRGNIVGNRALHEWVKRYLPKPQSCEHCNDNKSWLDLANKTGIYNREFNNWLYLCRSCHMKMDYSNGLRKNRVGKYTNL